MGVFHVTLYISSSLFYFSFIVDNAKPICLFLKLYDLFKITQNFMC